MRAAVVWISLLVQMLPASAYAFGESETGGWGSSCGWACGTGGENGGFPDDLEDDAKNLREQYLGEELVDLLDQQVLGVLCANQFCGQLDEGMASKLLDRLIATEQEKYISRQQLEATWTARLGMLLTALGLLVSWLAYRQSKAAEQLSIRNEVEISHLKAADRPQD